MTLSDFIEELEIAIKQDGHDIYCAADTAEMIKRHLLLNSQYFQQKEKRITNDKAIKMLTAKRDCIKREKSGIDVDCNNDKCEMCSLCYEQGTMGEQVEALDTAIKALETVDKTARQLEILADVLDGCHLTQPCDEFWEPTGWCENIAKTDRKHQVKSVGLSMQKR